MADINQYSKDEKNNKSKKLDFNIKGLDIDKNEYQEIILSNSNHPESTYYERYRG